MKGEQGRTNEKEKCNRDNYEKRQTVKAMPEQEEEEWHKTVAEVKEKTVDGERSKSSDRTRIRDKENTVRIWDTWKRNTTEKLLNRDKLK